VLIKSNNPSPRTFRLFQGCHTDRPAATLRLSLSLNDLLYYIIYIYLDCDSRSRAAEATHGDDLERQEI